MTARSKARGRALDLLFEAEQREISFSEVLDERSKETDRPIPDYAVTLVKGICAQQERIDELLSTYSVGWQLDRMPAVDRNVLRIGAYELLYADDVPDGVAISEAVALARDLSTEGSPQFVNGLLARIQRLKSSLPP